MTAKFLEAYVAMPPKPKQSARQCIDFKDFQTWQSDKDASPIDVAGLQHRDSAQSMHIRVDPFQTLSRGSGPSSSSGVTPPTAQTVTPDGSNTFLADPTQTQMFDTNFGYPAPSTASPGTANLLGKFEPENFVNNPFPTDGSRQAGTFGSGVSGMAQNPFDMTGSNDMLFGTSVPDKMNLAFGTIPPSQGARFTEINADSGNLWQGGSR